MVTAQDANQSQTENHQEMPEHSVHKNTHEDQSTGTQTIGIQVEPIQEAQNITTEQKDQTASITKTAGADMESVEMDVHIDIPNHAENSWYEETKHRTEM